MILLTAGALTDPQLPARASNVYTTDARLGGIGRVASAGCPPPKQKCILATPVAVAYPGSWTAQSAFILPDRPVRSDTNRLLWETFSHTAITDRRLFTHIPFIHLSELGRRGDNENAKTSKEGKGEGNTGT